mmetsp:Transcript_2005/g.8418  ORF Transcript_2005/g.8418 Transcript_2005/m.8418 type:complete len:289 (+) Transcript_2005:1641-2507(+)
MDGGLPRRRRRGPILREDGKSRGRRRARGRSRQPLDAEMGREVGRPGRMHQVDGYLGQPRPRRGRHVKRPLQVLGREVGGEMGRQLQRKRSRRSQAGSRLGRARRQPQGAHVGRRALPRRQASQVRKLQRRIAVLGRVVRRRRGVVGDGAVVRVARGHWALPVAHEREAAAEGGDGKRQERPQHHHAAPVKEGQHRPGRLHKRCLQPQRIPRQREQPVQADQARLQRRVPERVQRVLLSHQRRQQRQRRAPSSGWLRPQRSERRRRRALTMMHSIHFSSVSKFSSRFT